jgi:acyl-CoA hydrolase
MYADAFETDPAIGKAGGFGGVILHGLSTFGFAARALIKAVGGGDPRSLTFFGVRFTSPVKPGDALETEAWEVGPGPKGTIEVAFVTKNLTSGKVSRYFIYFWCLLTTNCRPRSAVELRTSKRRLRRNCKIARTWIVSLLYLLFI